VCDAVRDAVCVLHDVAQVLCDAIRGPRDTDYAVCRAVKVMYDTITMLCDAFTVLCDAVAVLCDAITVLCNATRDAPHELLGVRSGVGRVRLRVRTVSAESRERRGGKQRARSTQQTE
jgi:hypothetical protein